MFGINEVLRDYGLKQLDIVRATNRDKTTISRVIQGKYHSGRLGRIRNEVAEALSRMGVAEADLERLWQVHDSGERRAESAAAYQKHTEDYMAKYLDHDTLRHFGFPADPFGRPRTREDVFPSRNQQLAVEAIVHAAETHGFAAVMGETGSGKTIARDCAWDRLLRNGRTQVIYPEPIFTERLTAPLIVDTILHEMNQEQPRSLSKKGRLIKDTLIKSLDADKRILLIIEEAHLLHHSTLRAMKHLHELQHGFEKLMGIVMIGQGGLRRKINNIHLEEVSSRCSRVEMSVMSLDEIEEYLRFRTRRALRNVDAADIFSPEAVRHIAARAKYPQKIDNLARLLLNTAYDVRNAHPHGGKVVDEDVLEAV